jgi:prepilin-type N-terminal cleavage/methylation domain-containing protein
MPPHQCLVVVQRRTQQRYGVNAPQLRCRARSPTLAIALAARRVLRYPLPLNYLMALPSPGRWTGRLSTRLLERHNPEFQLMSSARRGFTLIETIIVMLLFSILTLLALQPAMRSLRTQRLNTAAAQVEADLSRARNEAIRRNVAVAFTRNSTTTYTIAGLGTRTLPNSVVFDPVSSAGATFTTYGTITATSAQVFNLRVHAHNREVTVNRAGFVWLQ